MSLISNIYDRAIGYMPFVLLLIVGVLITSLWVDFSGEVEKDWAGNFSQNPPPPVINTLSVEPAIVFPGSTVAIHVDADPAPAFSTKLSYEWLNGFKVFNGCKGVFGQSLTSSGNSVSFTFDDSIDGVQTCLLGVRVSDNFGNTTEGVVTVYLDRQPSPF